MRRPTKPDPYTRFKDDDQRRRALATRERWWAVASMVAAIAGAIGLKGDLQWLTYLLH